MHAIDFLIKFKYIVVITNKIYIITKIIFFKNNQFNTTICLNLIKKLHIIHLKLVITFYKWYPFYNYNIYQLSNYDIGNTMYYNIHDSYKVMLGIVNKVINEEQG